MDKSLYASFLALFVCFLIASTGRLPIGCMRPFSGSCVNAGYFMQPGCPMCHHRQIAEAYGCERLSRTYLDPCVVETDGCTDRCINDEHAVGGGCHWNWRGPACYCYFC